LKLVRLPPSVGRRGDLYLLSQKSLSSILSTASLPTCVPCPPRDGLAVASVPYFNLRKSAQSAELFLLSLSLVSSVVKSQVISARPPKHAREPPAHGGQAVRSPDLWNLCHPWWSAPSLIGVYSCPPAREEFRSSCLVPEKS
jgi:hypothetical protein